MRRLLVALRSELFTSLRSCGLSGRGYSDVIPKFLWEWGLVLPKVWRLAGSTYTLHLRPAHSLPFSTPMIWGACCFLWDLKCVLLCSFFIFWSTFISRLFDSFCIADLNTLGASTVPSPRCEAPPEQGHKVLEAGTRYPYNENCEIIHYNLFWKKFKVFWISRHNVIEISKISQSCKDKIISCFWKFVTIFSEKLHCLGLVVFYLGDTTIISKK